MMDQRDDNPKPGRSPEPWATLDGRLQREEVRRRLFGEAAEPVRLGKFVLERRLGAGSMGVVYVARDEQLDRKVALKLVKSAAEAERAQARLLREAQVMARLSHPNVAVVHEVGLWEGHVFMAMELVRGQTLREWLGSQKRSVQDILGVFVQAAQGLAAAHEQGLVHRDFKPDNVMVGDDDRVRVVDFGLARVDTPGANEEASTHSLSPVVSTFAIAGTPAYMSPEQHEGEPIDASADQFAFCVALYEALFGERPFAGDSVEQIRENIKRGVVRPSRARVPSWLRSVVLRGLSARPKDRFPTMKALVAALSAQGASRRRWLLPAALLTLVGAVLALFPFRNSPSATDTKVISRPVNAEALAAFRRGLDDVRRRGPIPEEFERALSLDPSFAEAHLYLASFAYIRVTPERRAHFREAERGRDSFSPRDRALLDAIEPVVRRQPEDWAEGARRLRLALDRFPHDAYLWFLLGVWQTDLGELEPGIASFDRSLREDPEHVATYIGKTWNLLFLGRFEEARPLLTLTARDPYWLADSMSLLAHLFAEEGACGAMEELSRQKIASGKEVDIAYYFLAQSLVAQGKPVATVREALRHVDNQAPPSRRNRLSGALQNALAMWEGDFELAERLARDDLRKADTSDQVDEHAGPVLRLIRVLLETGREAEAASVAMDYLDRREAWEANSTRAVDAVMFDPVPILLRVARRAGRLARDEVLRRRATWEAERSADVSPFFRGYVWLQGYGASVETVEEARDTLEALPRYSPLPPFELRTLRRVGLGPAYVLDGRPAEAIAPLLEVTRACHGLAYAYDHTRAHAWLGRAREALGDTQGACSAYEVVMNRWGQAKPRSVTAEDVRARARALGCDDTRGGVKKGSAG